MGQFDGIIKRGFLTEASELLDRAETLFLDLEREPTNRTIVDELFRLIHTVKSSAFAAGFEALGSFIHLIESLLSTIREGRVATDPQTVDLLLKSNDRLRQIVGQLTTNYEAVFDTSDIDGALLSALNHGQPAGNQDASARMAERSVAPFSGRSTKNQFSESSAKRVVAQFGLPSPPQGVQLTSAMTPTILLCDDEPEILLLAAEMLRFRFPILNIISAEDGLDAHEKLKAFKPHVIITDMRMPKLNGIEFIREVRKVDGNVPVIFFSAYADRDNMIDFIKLGVIDFHEKPIDPDRLSLSVATALKLAQNREGIARLSTLNFKAYMSTLRLSQLGPEQKREATEISAKVKLILDEVAVLSNFMLGL